MNRTEVDVPVVLIFLYAVLSSIMNWLIFMATQTLVRRLSQHEVWQETKVSLLGVASLCGDCTFIPADWGS